MPFRLASVSLVLLLLLAPAPAVADFVFVHASDPHFSESPDRAAANAKVLDEIRALQPKPAFVVTTGDIAEIGTDREYEFYRDTVEQHAGGVPVYNAPGNHDVRWNPRGKEGYTRGVGQPLFQSWDHDGVHFVTLDSTVLLQHWGHVSQDQLDWLKADLEKVGRETPVVIAFHHWIGRDKVQVDNEQALLDLVEPYNVVLWLQGHGHSDIQWNVNGTPAVMQKGLYQGSYATVEKVGDVLKVRRRALGKAGEKQSNELVRDKATPATDNVVWTDVMTVPLRKPATPQWSAEAKVADGAVVATARRGDLPDGVTLGYRLNEGEYKPMTADGDSWTARAPAEDLVAGNHVVTLQAALPDGRRYQKSVPVTVDSPAAPEPAWTTNVGGAVQSRLVRAGDLLYVTTMGGDLVALDPDTGGERWRVTTGGPVFSTPHVDESAGAVYVGSADHHVYAVDARTGEVRWKTKTGGAVLAGAGSARGVVCIASVDRNIYGLDQQTGSVLWTVPGGNMFQSKAATDGERFFVGGWDNAFRAIDAKTGEVAWQQKLGKSAKGAVLFYFAPAIASPAVNDEDGLVYVVSNDGVLHAMDTATGETRWTFDGKKIGYSSPLYRDGRVYGAIGDAGKTFCWDAKTGELQWESDTGSVIYDSSFAASDGRLFIGNVNGTFNCLDSDTGKVLWQYRLGPGHLLASPAADESRAYISSMSGNVVALPAKPQAATQR